MINEDVIRQHFGAGKIAWFRDAGFLHKIWMLFFCKEHYSQEIIGDTWYYKSRDCIYYTKFLVDPYYFSTIDGAVITGSETTQ